MVNQPRGGHIFNIDGAGSDGRPTPRYFFGFTRVFPSLILVQFPAYTVEILLFIC